MYSLPIPSIYTWSIAEEKEVRGRGRERGERGSTRTVINSSAWSSLNWNIVSSLIRLKRQFLDWKAVSLRCEKRNSWNFLRVERYEDSLSQSPWSECIHSADGTPRLSFASLCLCLPAWAHGWTRDGIEKTGLPRRDPKIWRNTNTYYEPSSLVSPIGEPFVSAPLRLLLPNLHDFQILTRNEWI